MYHVTNTVRRPGASLPREIFRQAGMQVTSRPITTADYGAPAARPAYSVLDTSAYHRLGGPADAGLEGGTGGVLCRVDGMQNEK